MFTRLPSINYGARFEWHLEISTALRQWEAKKFPAKSGLLISAKEEFLLFNLKGGKIESKYIYIKQAVFPSSGMLWYINEALNSEV